MPLRARWGFGGVPPRVNQKRVNQPYQQLNAVEDIALRSHVGRYAGAQDDQGLSLIRSSSIPVRWMQAPDRHALRPGSPATPAESEPINHVGPSANRVLKAHPGADHASSQ